MHLKFTLLLVLIANISFAQTNLFPTSGPVGIGMTNPTKDIDIYSVLPSIRTRSSDYTNNPTVVTRKASIIFSNAHYDKTAGISGAVPPGYHVPGILFSTKSAWNSPGTGSEDWDDRMFIHPSGNVGIGTTNPLNKLHVNGAIQLDGSVALPTNAEAGNSANYASNYNLKLSGGQNGFYIALSGQFNDRRTYIQCGHSNTDYAYGVGTITLNPFGGNVGIGTGTVAPDAKLAVKGVIHAQEVRVDMTGAMVPDYVFEKNYNLRPLAEVENYINQNKHLPEVPAAKEMEANGVNLGEMDMLLLKKVEELTLYLLDQNKIIQQQTEEIEMLKNQIIEIKAK